MSENKATKDKKDEKIEAQKEAEVIADIKEVIAPVIESEPVIDSGVVAEVAKPAFQPQGQGRRGGGGGGGRFSNRPRRETEPKEFEEKVVAVDRVTRVVKGGRRMRFRALVVIGDKKGRVSYATGKGNEVATAVGKAVNQAKKNLVTVQILEGTIAHDIIGKSSTTRVLLKKAKKGTGIIAGGSVRVVLELAGYSNIVAKSYGSNNKINNVIATIDALQSLLEYKKKEPKNNINKEDKK